MCLGQRYPAPRMEAAAERALLTGAVSYKSLDSVLRHRRDQQPLDLTGPTFCTTANERVYITAYTQSLGFRAGFAADSRIGMAPPPWLWESSQKKPGYTAKSLL
jgi:hypothetical protein